ncbi:DsbA family oxidoreductase [Vibrio cyclitrophicus]|uniref:DsbA family oxidoreductase n=1 Tax=Vibrio cyclitrophicus TaxID=47951 RepID=UPI0032E44F80
MSNKLQLDIISDVMCPWCVVGYKNLEQAIAELSLAGQIELEWQPFELNPDMPQEGENMRDHIMRKYGSSAEESQRSREQIVDRGKAVGFDFNFYESMRMVNSRHLHVLLDFALAYGKQTELKLRFFHAHFTEEKDLSDLEVIAQELEAVGLDSNKALKRLKNTDNLKKIQAQEFEWQRMGISAVPTVVFNRKSAMTGAQTVETYKQILQELIAES